jgi:hypothetical protein
VRVRAYDTKSGTIVAAHALSGGQFGAPGTSQMPLPQRAGAAGFQANYLLYCLLANQLAMEAIGSSPEEFANLIKLETPKWASVIKQAGIKATD